MRGSEARHSPVGAGSDDSGSSERVFSYTSKPAAAQFFLKPVPITREIFDLTSNLPTGMTSYQ